MSSYYDSNTLAHYGVSGQKWGVRRYQNEDGSLTQLGKEHYGLSSSNSQGNSKLAKKYEREVKKLKKYDEQSDRVGQMEKALAYDKKAKTAKRIGNAALAVALPSAGIGALSKNKTNIRDKLFGTAWEAYDRAKVFENLNASGRTAFMTNENKERIADTAQKYLDIVDAADEADKAMMNVPDAKYAGTANAVAVVAGTAAAVAYGASAYNRVQSTLAKRRITDKGHAKAVARRDAQYQKITNMVKGTSYMSLFKDQIAAYKKEHPNTELSDKQIMKNLM